MRTVLAALCILGLTGCSTLLRPTVTETPVTVAGHTNIVVVTNTLPPVIVTNTVAGTPVVVTNYAPPVVVTNVLVTPPTTTVLTVTNWIPNPAITAGIQTAQQLNGALNPTPTAPIVNWALTGLTGLLGLVAAWKNKQAGVAQSSLNTVISAIETYPGSQLDAVKQHIQSVSAILGTSESLDKSVQSTATKVAAAVPKLIPSLTAEQLLAFATNPKADLSGLSAEVQAAIAKIRA